MPQIRTTINPEHVVEVSQKELDYLASVGLVREVVNPEVPEVPESGTKKATTKETR